MKSSMWFWRRFFKMYFCYFAFISPWKRVRPFIWTNLNLLQQRMLCGKILWHWPSGSGEDILISSYFCSFVIISPWKRARHFIWTNLNPNHPRMLGLIEFGPLVLEKKKMRKVYDHYDDHLSLWFKWAKRWAIHCWFMQTTK